MGMSACPGSDMVTPDAVDSTAATPESVNVIFFYQTFFTYFAFYDSFVRHCIAIHFLEIFRYDFGMTDWKTPIFANKRIETEDVDVLDSFVLFSLKKTIFCCEKTDFNYLLLTM